MGGKTGKTLRLIMTDLLAPTTNIALFDGVIGATEADHLPIICLTNHPPLGSRNGTRVRRDLMLHESAFCVALWHGRKAVTSLVPLT